MRVAIVYNEPEPSAPAAHWLSRATPDGAQLPPDFRDASEHGVLDEIRVIERAVRAAGHEPLMHAVTTASALAEFLEREHPDAVFNCCESFRGVAALEMSVAGLFELFGVTYTGSSALTLGLALDKALTKSLLRASGIATPEFRVMRTPADLGVAHGLAYPLIVKPVAEDASIGIDVGALVRDEAALRWRVEFVWREFTQPALVEEFIDGRELNVGLLADDNDQLQPLPIAEIPFDALPPGTPAIVSYEAKWVPDSAVYKATMSRCPATLEPELAERVRHLAQSAARVVRLRDYGRVDMRLRAADGALFVLEVNPNPDLFDEAGFMRAASASGRTVPATVCQILSRAVARAEAVRACMPRSASR